MAAVIDLESPIELLLVGHDRPEFREAARLATGAGAHVILCETIDSALARARLGGTDLAMVDVGADIDGFIRQLRAERIVLPVLGCGVNSPADRAVAAIRAGAQDYLPLPPQADLIAAALVSVAVRSQRLIGDAPAFRQASKFALAMARTTAPMLILGETGSGRETLARAVHQASGRKGRFVAVNIAEVSLSDGLLEAELFGQEAGAFEGAVAQRRGRVEEASGGTLYLGEVGLLSPPIQARLLTLLASRRLRRLGGSDDVSADVRVISGSALDLQSRVASGALHPDLFERLGAVRVNLPALRERTGDIGLIAAYFAERFAQNHGLPTRPLSSKAVEILSAQPWPGNVRELEFAMLRAVMMATGDVIGPEALTRTDGSAMTMPMTAANPTEQVRGEAQDQAAHGAKLVGRTVADVEKELILSTLAQCRGNRTTASAILGISVRTMRNKLKSFVDTGMSAGAAL